MSKCKISQKCFYFCLILSISKNYPNTNASDLFCGHIFWQRNRIFYQNFVLCYTVLLEYCNFIMYIILLCSGSYSYPALGRFRIQNIITLDISFLFLSTEQTPVLATFIQMSLHNNNTVLELNPHQV